jgi:hypothetical protein
MSEFDERGRLRGADPVDPRAIPSADDPGPRALRERIVMSETDVTRRRVPMIAAAATAVVLVAGGTVFATRGGAPAPVPIEPGPIAPGISAMCVELYSLETLAAREFAFDGTVTEVNGDAISFDVTEWFHGGEGDAVSLEGALTLSGLSTAGDAVPIEPGTRLLVAGDDTFLWGCDFTQPYDASVAADWRATLS